MTLSSQLRALAHRSLFGQQVSIEKRWGQLLRTAGEVGHLLEAGRSTGVLVPLRKLATLRGGVVTRANSYFLVRELPFGQVPNRFRLTRADYRHIAIVLDGLDTANRIERRFLRPVLKGPESLLTPTRTVPSDLRVVVCNLSESELRDQRATGMLAYLNRGRTQDYRVSDDNLKGGIPAERSNIRNRRPYWYSLSVPTVAGCRIVLPEHVDRRYPATLLGSDDNDTVVIDKLYIAEVESPESALGLCVGLNSALTWFQLELRGRTQLGEGVLEIKKPDWGGVLVLRPDLVTLECERAFAAIANKEGVQAIDSLFDVERLGFDEQYLRQVGAADGGALCETIAREISASVAERHDRKESVRDPRGERQRQRRVSANVDAYAARVAARVESYPDPRHFVPTGMPTIAVVIRGPLHGELTVGEDLFTVGRVMAGGEPIADTGDLHSARFVRAVLLHDPALSVVLVPPGEQIESVVQAWSTEAERWKGQFEVVLNETLAGITDPRARTDIRRRALTLLHAEN